MASKRSKSELLESPPSVSPSSSHEDDGDESSSEDLTPLPKPSTQKPPSSSGDSAFESESDSESEPEPQITVPEPVVKPQISKAVDQASTTKPRSKPSPKATSSSAAAKRPAETDRGKEPKKAKIGGKGDGTVEKTTPRVWSEEEEIAILKGMIDYEVKIGLSPATDMEAFHAFIKKSLLADASRNQLYDKLRRLKKKYWDNVEKLKKNANVSSLWKAHDKKLFELSKKVWISEGNGLQSPNKIEKKTENVKPAVKTKKNENQSVSKLSPKLPTKKLETSLTPSVDCTKEAETSITQLADGAKELVTSLTPKDVEETGAERNMDPFMSLGVSHLLGKKPESGDMENYVIQRGLSLIKGPQKAELEERWIKLQNDELELFVERTKLILDQTKLVLAARKV